MSLSSRLRAGNQVGVLRWIRLVTLARDVSYNPTRLRIAARVSRAFAKRAC